MVEGKVQQPCCMARTDKGLQPSRVGAQTWLVLLGDDWFTGTNFGFDLFEPLPLLERNHGDRLIAVSLNHNRPVGVGDQLEKEAQRVAKMRDLDWWGTWFDFIHELLPSSDMYNNTNLLISAAVPKAVPTKRNRSLSAVGVTAQHVRPVAFSLPIGVLGWCFFALALCPRVSPHAVAEPWGVPLARAPRGC